MALLYHPESGCYFYGQLAEYPNGEVEDVTDEPIHEMQASVQLMNIAEQVARQKNDISLSHWKCCLNCMNFDKNTITCLQANNQIPPLEVMVSGCEKWEDEIPF